MGARLSTGLYRRNGVIWVRTDPVDGKQRSTRCRDPKAANLWLAERERLGASPHYAASTQATVGEWILKTLAHKKAQQKSDGTLHMYGVKLGHVARLFGPSSPLSTVTASAVDAYVAQRSSEGAVNNTISRELTCLRQMLRLSRRAGVFALGLDEVMPIGFSANYTPVTRTLTWAQFQTLMAGLDETQAAWVCLAVATAGDVSDVERMRPEDFDTDRWLVKMRGTKNKARSATIPIPELFRPLVERALPHLPVTWPRASKALGEITKRLSLGHFSPKDLRRSACTWLVEAGVPEDAVSRWMRHKNSTMVRMIYGQMRPEALGQIIDERVQKRYKKRGPLGEIGKREGFKSRRVVPLHRDLRKILGLARRELARRGLARRTESLQSAARLRVERLRLFAMVSRADALPGLALSMGVIAAESGRSARRHLETAARALGGAA